MAVGYDISLSTSEANKTSTGPISLGDTRGGGQSFSFGGINDSPVSKWIWLGLGTVLLLGGAALWWNTRKNK